MLATATILIITVQVAFTWLVYHKLSTAIQQAQRDAKSQANNTISQIEALLAIAAEVHPKRALPKSRGWAASPDFLAVLIGLTHDRHPEVIVECSSGYSTLVLASVLQNIGRGHVYSMEHDIEYAAKTRAMLELHELSDWVTVIHAPLKEQAFGDWQGRWYDASALPKDLRVDMLVIDGPPQSTGPLARFPAVPALFDLLTDKGLIVLDDAARHDETAATATWLKKYPTLDRVPVADCEKGCIVLRKTNNR